MSEFNAPLEKHIPHHASKSGRKADKKKDNSMLCTAVSYNFHSNRRKCDQVFLFVRNRDEEKGRSREASKKYSSRSVLSQVSCEGGKFAIDAAYYFCSYIVYSPSHGYPL